MLGIFSSGPTEEKKETVLKEDYDTVVEENTIFSDKVRLLELEVAEKGERVKTEEQRLSELESFVNSKQKLIELFNFKEGEISSSDLKVAEKLKQMLEQKVKTSEKYNLETLKELDKLYKEANKKIKADEYDKMKDKTKEMAEMITIQLIAVPEDPIKFQCPNLEQLRKELVELDNYEDVCKHIKEMPNKQDEYDKHEVD